MSNFKLKNSTLYKLAKHNSQTISNDIMTDDLAIAFIKLRRERIELFSKFPENWEELIGDKPKVKEENLDTSKSKVKKSTNKKKPCSNCKEKRKVTPKNEAI